MKRFLYFISIVVVLSVVLSACGGNAGPLPGAAGADATEPPATEPPATEPPATEPPVATELVTVDLAGPPMVLGSKYPYVDGTILVAVPGGPFIMGYNSADNPVHEVTVSDFWIYSTKVTNSQYALCVQSGKCSPPDKENSPTYDNYRFINHPVTGVNYDQAAVYCEFVHGRLPTEAEWEKTARGPEGNLFPWGDGAAVCDLLNFKFCEGKTTPINDYPKGVSYYSAYDMSGNVREWVADWYSPTYYSESPAADPLGPELGEKRSVRGSSYQDSADPSISAHRFSFKPTENLPDLGFRCIVEDPTYFAPMCTQIAYIGSGPSGEEANCTPEVKCNDVSLVFSPLCTQNKVPYTIANFALAGNPPDGWTRDVPGCTELGGGTATSAQFQCDPGAVGPAQTSGSCMDVSSCVSACPLHYNKVGDECVWDGSGTIGRECLPGMTYDPLLQCCSATPGSGINFDLCPAGFYPLGGACIANPPKIVETINLPVPFLSCIPNDGGDDGDDTCDPAKDPNCQPSGCPVQSCTFGSWDPVLCCCFSAAKGGCT